MSRLLCCACRPAPPEPSPPTARASASPQPPAPPSARPDMGAALSQPHTERPPPTMAIVIRERKKKAGGAALGTLRRRLAAAARRPNSGRPDRGCEHARFIRSVVANWRLAEVWLLCDELEALNALRDLQTQAELAREPAACLGAALATARAQRVGVDVEVAGAGWVLPAHRAVLAARSKYFQHLLHKHPPNSRRITLCGAAAHLTAEEMEAVLHTMYTGGPPSPSPAASTQPAPASSASADLEGARCTHTPDLDILSDSTNTLGSTRSRGDRCSCGVGGGNAAGSARRIASLSALMGVSPLALHQHMRYLLDSREYADTRLVWANGGPEMPCHRFVLAARSRFFRGVMTRREGGSGAGAVAGVGAGAGGAVCVDDKVLPVRFARALLHAAYTDQVDLSLIGRPCSPTNSSGPSLPSSPWGGGARAPTAASQQLDDAFQLYEIARFLEMPIVVQGCEDAIVEALTHETLGRVLQWAAQPHASQWVHRQAMRYLRDEFPSIMSSAHGAAVPRAALAEALASPFLQASEAQALRALLRWGAAQHPAPSHDEPNVVWHTAHSWAARAGGAAGAGGGASGGGVRVSRRRRDVSDATLRELLASLLGGVRLEHLPPNTDTLHHAIRRGIVPEDSVGSDAGSCAAWLGRGVGRRPARCFLPYLDELQALLSDQRPPPELASMRTPRAPRPIPDTLYMVAAARGPEAPVAEGEAACVSPRVLAALRARVRELRASPPALRAAALPAADPAAIHLQIALRAVRERSLPDACAELVRVPDPPPPPPAAPALPNALPTASLPAALSRQDKDSYGCLGPCERPARASRSSEPEPELHIPAESSRSSSAGTCRRDQLPHRSSSAEWWRAGAGAGSGGGGLSACVPDVAMAPNANTHLLTHRDYHPHPLVHSHPLQLDLGDGATHPPAPGSRALRAHVRHRDYSQGICLYDRMEREREPPREERSDELRAALQLSVIRAYSSFAAGNGGGGSGGGGGGGSPTPTPLARRTPHPVQPSHSNTLPHSYRENVQLSSYPTGVAGAGAGAASSLRMSPVPMPAALALHRRDTDAGSAGIGVGSVASSVSERSPRVRRPHYRLDYRLDAGYSERDRGAGGEADERCSLPPSHSPSPRDYA